MAKKITKRATAYVGSLEVAANLKGLDVGEQAAEVETTNLASDGFREFLQGLKESTWDFDGFAEAAAITGDPQTTVRGMYTGGSATPLFISLDRPVVDGSLAVVAQAIATKFSNMVKIGEVWAFALSAKGTGATVQGAVVEAVTRTATGTSADSLTLPAVAAGERLYYLAIVPATSGTGEELDLVLESDADDTFASATTRATLTQFTGTGTQFGSVAGPITDVEWRVSATVAGTDPSFTYLVFIGIAT